MLSMCLVTFPLTHKPLALWNAPRSSRFHLLYYSQPTFHLYPDLSLPTIHFFSFTTAIFTYSHHCPLTTKQLLTWMAPNTFCMAPNAFCMDNLPPNLRHWQRCKTPITSINFNGHKYFSLWDLCFNLNLLFFFSFSLLLPTVYWHGLSPRFPQSHILSNKVPPSAEQKLKQTPLLQ